MKKLLLTLAVALIAVCLACVLWACAPEEEQAEQPGGQDAPGPQPHVHDLMFVRETPATCTDTGMAQHWACRSCGKMFSDGATETEVRGAELVIPELGHDLVLHDAVAPTCDDYGILCYRECSRCGYCLVGEQGDEELPGDTTDYNAPPLGHDFGEPEWVWTGTEAAEAHLTCLRDPSHTITVKATLSERVVISPSCTDEGSMEVTAEAWYEESVYTDTTTAAVSALGHVFDGAWQFDEDSHWKECSRCSATDGNAAHEAAVCEICGCVTSGTPGLAFKSNAAGVYVVTGFEEGAGDAVTELVIPSFHNGGRVTEISGSAFRGNRSLTSVTVPAGIATIGDEAFYGTTSLVELNWYASDISLTADSSLFGDSGKNSSGINVRFGDSVLKVPSYLFMVGGNTPNDEPYVKSVELGAAVKEIGANAFYFCQQLTSIDITDGVEKIGEYAFYYCIALTSVTIGEGVREIGKYAFYNCNSLERVEYNAVSAATAGENGNIFYNAGGKNGMTVVFGDSVRDIPDFLFYSNLYKYARIVSLTLGSGVETIGIGSFCGVDDLTLVVLPASLTAIGEQAFSGCSSLASVSYDGSMSAWNKVEKGARWSAYTKVEGVSCTNGTASV